MAVFLSVVSGLFSLPFVILGVAGLVGTLSVGSAGGSGEVVLFSSIVLLTIGGLGIFISVRWLRYVYRED